MAKQRKWFIGAGIGIALLIGLVVAAASSPPVFISFGNHYAGGTNLLSTLGMWRCDPVPTEECTPVREDLLAAIGNDPHIQNWWPVRISFFNLD